MSVGTLQHLEKAFKNVGWFLPPYAALGFLSPLGGEILRRGEDFGQGDLEERLGYLYGPEGLAAMVCNSYSITPVICDYQKTISESIEAHFLGLHHVAVAGLVPVIEGAGRDLLQQRGLSSKSVQGVFAKLAKDCKREAVEKQLGAIGEVISMLDSFLWFAENILYAGTGMNQFLDGANRNGITHGAYKDVNYGKPINFYKVIGAIDFLCFVSAFRASISWLAPDPSIASRNLAIYYHVLQVIQSKRLVTNA
jgi:hypothetical protein